MYQRRRPARLGATVSSLLPAVASRRQFLGGAFIASAALLTSTSKARAEPAVYHLGPNDRVRITVFGEDRLSGEFILDGAGRLSYPLLGSIDALGATTDELAEAIRRGLAGRFILEPKVAADVAAFRSFYILGEVVQPGQYPAVEGLTLLAAVATAKGFTPRANRRSATVKNAQTNHAARLRIRDNVLVRPGDIIVVNERWF